MGGKSNIEWTDSSWTPIRARNLKTGKLGWHCEHDTTGCEFCYSEAMNRRLGTGLPFKPGHRKDIEIFLDEEMLLAPLRWRKPRMVFVCSMTDAFADFVSDEWLDKVFAVMALCPQHTFQVLTKRAERMRSYIEEVMADQRLGLNRFGITALATGLCGPAGSLPAWPLPNVWLGTSAERQQEWDERKEHLRNTPAAVRFVSFEPLLGPIVEPKLADYIAWAIVGGESGSKARPLHPQWARDLRDQCVAAGVSFFFKQWGGWKDGSDFACDESVKAVLTDGRVIDQDLKSMQEADRINAVACFNPTLMRKVGKKAAGRLLDGREWNEFPGAQAA